MEIGLNLVQSELRGTHLGQLPSQEDRLQWDHKRTMGVPGHELRRSYSRLEWRRVAQQD